MLKALLSFFLLCFFSLGNAADVKPLPPDLAFKFSVYLQNDHELIAEWKIAPGYYLYRQQLTFTTASDSLVQLAKIALPKGEVKHDILHGVYQRYSGILQVLLPLSYADRGILKLDIGYQGCSLGGFCYAPIHKNLQVDLRLLHPPQDLTSYFVGTSASGSAQKVFAKQNTWLVGFTFLGLGLLLAFTPCVLPMVPILSSIIVGQHVRRRSVARAFGLSLMYVLGMAVTYAIAGVIAALVGSRIQTELQQPWIIVSFSALFLVLGFLLLGWYELHLPAHWRHRLNTLSHRWKGGTFFGAFMMGGFSSLIVSPCVSAPLVGVLTYITQTGNVFLGGFALLCLGLGMGIPLLLVGLSAGALLPKAGKWMTAIEKFFGVMMLAMAIWILSRVVSASFILFLSGILCILVAIELGLLSRSIRSFGLARRILEVSVFVYGILLIVSASLGHTRFTVWNDWRIAIYPVENRVDSSRFVTLNSMQELDEALSNAVRQKKPVIIDFYADWCVSCITMEKKVWGNDIVRQALADFVLLRADVTKNNNVDQAMLDRFNVIAPPAIIFIDRKGSESIRNRIEGEVSAKQFLVQLMKTEESKRESN